MSKVQKKDAGCQVSERDILYTMTSSDIRDSLRSFSGENQNDYSSGTNNSRRLSNPPGQGINNLGCAPSNFAPGFATGMPYGQPACNMNSPISNFTQSAPFFPSIPVYQPGTPGFYNNQQPVQLFDVNHNVYMANGQYFPHYQPPMPYMQPQQRWFRPQWVQKNNTGQYQTAKRKPTLPRMVCSDELENKKSRTDLNESSESIPNSNDIKKDVSLSRMNLQMPGKRTKPTKTKVDHFLPLKSSSTLADNHPNYQSNYPTATAIIDSNEPLNIDISSMSTPQNTLEERIKEILAQSGMTWNRDEDDVEEQTNGNEENMDEVLGEQTDEEEEEVSPDENILEEQMDEKTNDEDESVKTAEEMNDDDSEGEISDENEKIEYQMNDEDGSEERSTDGRLIEGNKDDENEKIEYQMNDEDGSDERSNDGRSIEEKKDDETENMTIEHQMDHETDQEQEASDEKLVEEEKNDGNEALEEFLNFMEEFNEELLKREKSDRNIRLPTTGDHEDLKAYMKRIGITNIRQL
uniref:Uncharacterized protein n=1 Tax=Panagrolaimus sp. JU765 TaxID=591449 RepID=A0AC34RNK3_9BILA